MTHWFDQITDDDEERIAAFMHLLAAPTAVPPHASDVRVLWLKGQLLRRWEAERLVHRPIDIADRLQLVGGLLTAAAVVVMVVLR
jgi:hypothetical protein